MAPSQNFVLDNYRRGIAKSHTINTCVRMCVSCMGLCGTSGSQASIGKEGQFHPLHPRVKISYASFWKYPPPKKKKHSEFLAPLALYLCPRCGTRSLRRSGRKYRRRIVRDTPEIRQRYVRKLPPVSHRGASQNCDILSDNNSELPRSTHQMGESIIPGHKNTPGDTKLKTPGHYRDQ